jgi:hypothetical protein
MADRSSAALSGKLARISSTAETPAIPVAAPNLGSEKFPENRATPRRVPRAALLIVVGLAIVGLSIGLWHFVLRDRFVPKRFGVVVPGKVFRSGQISRHLIAGVIDSHQIGTIIDLNGLDPADADQRAELEVAEAKGVQHLRFPLRGDATGQIERYAGAVEAIVASERAGRPVLVHCAAGSQRTGACVSFYRLLVRHDPPADVYCELASYGWDPRTNQVLLDYVNGHMSELAQLLVERHVIDRAPTPLPSLHP